MTVYRIFVADIGEYKNSTKYRFIADFSDAKTASDYVGFMRGKKRYAKQDIIVKEVTVTEIDTAALHGGQPNPNHARRSRRRGLHDRNDDDRS